MEFLPLSCMARSRSQVFTVSFHFQKTEREDKESLQPTPVVVPVHNVAELIQVDRIHAEQCWVENPSRRHYQQRHVVLQVHVTHLQE